MRDAAVAFSFLANLSLPALARRAPRPSRFYRADGERVDLDVYEPRGALLGTVVLALGMNSRANRDPRVLVASQALAAVGVRVIAPRLPEVGRAVITTRTVDRIADTLVFAAEQAGGPVSVFAPSFSAGMSLIASTLDFAGDSVSSVFAMGSYSDAESVVRFVLDDPAAHPYGRLIVLKNFLHRSLGPVPEIEAVLDSCIVDLGLRRIEPGDRSHFLRLSADRRELLERDPRRRRLSQGTHR